jgi:predicted GH43/DUF377 family glycosyl hydrolase
LIRSPDNPILTREHVPDIPPDLVDVSSVFNPGAVVHNGRVLLLLRVQTRGRETFFVTAESDDGTRFEVRPGLVPVRGIERVVGAVYHCYDARITELEGRYYVVFAMDTDFGCRIGLATTDDFTTLEFVGMTGKDDVRNGVLFPERVGGRYLRYERPNKLRFGSGATSGDEIVLSESTDLVSWHPVASVMRGRLHYWDELIGPGPPPLKTRGGWLLVYHGIATHGSACIYQAGVVLTDLEDPSRVVARGRSNILEPRELYELVGQVPNVVFPTGAIVERCDSEGFADPAGEVRLYYGAADTCVCAASCTIGELLAACRG